MPEGDYPCYKPININNPKLPEPVEQQPCTGILSNAVANHLRQQEMDRIWHTIVEASRDS